MKKLTTIACLIFALVSAHAQSNFAAPPPDKAVIYFTRSTSSAFLITFMVFDSAQMIGQLGPRQYFRYECNPGSHVFWARSENRDFINAHVEAGKIYFVDTMPKMGALTAGVRIYPIDGKNPKETKRVLKMMAKKPAANQIPEIMAESTRNNQDIIGRGLRKYEEEKAKKKINMQLTPQMNYVP